MPFHSGYHLVGDLEMAMCAFCAATLQNLLQRNKPFKPTTSGDRRIKIRPKQARPPTGLTRGWDGGERRVDRDDYICLLVLLPSIALQVLDCMI